MTRQELIQWAKEKRWKESRRPSKKTYLYKQVDGREFRLVVSKISVRYETKGESSGYWFRVRSGYLKNLSISDSGKLKGLK